MSENGFEMQLPSRLGVVQRLSAVDTVVAKEIVRQFRNLDPFSPRPDECASDDLRQPALKDFFCLLIGGCFRLNRWGYYRFNNFGRLGEGLVSNGSRT